MNPINEYPALRRALYLVQWIVNLALGATAVVLTALGESPLWYVITTGVFNFVWTYTGLTAQANTDVLPSGTHHDDAADDPYMG